MADESKPKTGIKAGQLIEKYRARLRAERKAAKAKDAELAELKGRPSAEELQKKVDGYAKAEKERAYRAEFDKAARAAGITGEKALAAAWRLAEIDQTGEAPDAASIKTAVDAFAAENDYLKAPAGAGAETTPPPLKAPQGGGRGAPAADVAGRFSYSSADLANSVWMRANQDKLSAALDNGTAVKVG